jgi:hypothetical protein
LHTTTFFQKIVENAKRSFDGQRQMNQSRKVRISFSGTPEKPFMTLPLWTIFEFEEKIEFYWCTANIVPSFPLFCVFQNERKVDGLIH